MKQILLFLLLLSVTSCIKDDCMDVDLGGSINNVGANAGINAGIYHDTRVNGKYLSLEINTARGNLQAVDFTVVYVFSNSSSRISTVTLTDDDFDYEFDYKGFKGRTWITYNHVLDDPTIYLKEISIDGKLKIDEKWYSMEAKKEFNKNWQWISIASFYICFFIVIHPFLFLLIPQLFQGLQYILKLGK